MVQITSRDQVDALRMPSPFFGDDPRGMVDRDAVQAWSWGTDCDADAQRAKIAQALLAQQAARNAAPPLFSGLGGSSGGAGASGLYTGGSGGGGAADQDGSGQGGALGGSTGSTGT